MCQETEKLKKKSHDIFSLVPTLPINERSVLPAQHAAASRAPRHVIARNYRLPAWWRACNSRLPLACYPTSSSFLSSSLVLSSFRSVRSHSPSRSRLTSAGRHGGGGGRRSSALRERESRESAIVTTVNVLVRSPGRVATSLPLRRMGRSSRIPRRVPVEAS